MQGVSALSIHAVIWPVVGGLLLLGTCFVSYIYSRKIIPRAASKDCESGVPSDTKQIVPGAAAPVTVSRHAARAIGNEAWRSASNDGLPPASTR